MGVLEVFARVLTTYKADVRPHKRALRELKGEERKAQKEIIDNLNKRNEAWDRNIKKLGKVAGAVGGVTVAFIAGRAAWRTYAEDIKLRGATVGVSLNSLKHATRGLMTEQKLLHVSARLMNTDLKFTQTEIETLTQYMLALVKRGKDSAEVFREVTKAAEEANLEGLKRFGVTAKATGGTLEAKNAILRAAQLEIRKLGGDFDTAASEMERANVRIADAMHHTRLEVGRLVNSLAPLVAELLRVAAAAAQAVGGLIGVARAVGGRGVSGGGGEGWGKHVPGLNLGTVLTAPLQTSLMAVKGWGEIYGLTQPSTSPLIPGWMRNRETLRQQRGRELAQRLMLSLSSGTQPANLFELGKPTIIPPDRRGGGGPPLTPGGGGVFQDFGVNVPMVRARERDLELDRAFVSSGGVGARIAGPALGGQLPMFGAAYATPEERMGVTPDEFAQFLQGRGQRGVTDIFQGGFGAAQFTEAAGTVASEGFVIFQQAATASFNAVVSGSKSMATAFREAAGAMIAARASNLFAEGIYHSAMAVGSLFFSSITGAAHVRAALAAFSGAAALAGLARALGYGGATGAPGAQAGAGAGAARGIGGAPATSSRTIIIGGDFETDSRRRRQARMRAVLKRAEQEEGSGSTVSFD
jgi:hypothetical protein